MASAKPPHMPHCQPRSAKACTIQDGMSVMPEPESSPTFLSIEVRVGPGPEVHGPPGSVEAQVPGPPHPAGVAHRLEPELAARPLVCLDQIRLAGKAAEAHRGLLQQRQHRRDIL